MKLASRTLRIRMKGSDVRQMQNELRLLGYEINDREGYFGKSTQAAVQRFQREYRLPATGVFDQTTANQLSILLAEQGGFDGDGPITPEPPPGTHPNPPTPDIPPGEPAPENTHVVFGRVLQTNGPPANRVRVYAVHKNLRSEIPLARPSKTDDLGRYFIGYRPPDGVKEVNLIVRAVQLSTDDMLAESVLICDPPQKQQVDLVIGGSEYRGYSEYEQLNQALEPHLDGAPMTNLSADDIVFLDCITQQDPFRIAYLVIANQYARRTSAPAAAYYGLLRMQLPTRLPALLSQQSRVQREALEEALKANIIPAQMEKNIDKILHQLKQAAVDFALEVPEGGETTSLNALLGASGLSTGQQGAALAKYSLHEGTIQEFWSSLKKDPDFAEPGVVEDLQFTLQLGALAGGYAPMVQKLKEQQGQGQISTVKDLAAYEHSDWLDLIQETGTPPGIPGKSEEERTRSYAKLLAQTLELAFPTETVVAGLRRTNSPEQKDILQFFHNSPDYQFTTNIDQYIQANAETAFEGIPEPEKVTRQIKELQRLYRVAPETGRFEAMTALQGAGLSSAQAIVRMGQAPFMKSLAPSLEGEGAAKSIYAKADFTNALVLNSFGKYNSALSNGIPAVIRNLGTAGASIPTWETLFGSLSFCECEHCRSVYSPAAYFVDLLQFVKQQPAIRISSGGNVTYPTVTEEDGTVRPKTALDVLFERRSDLGEIELSCQNTNTLLAYVDLVNEALESVVAAQNGAAGGAAIPQPEAHQTTWTAEELAANPEHLKEKAYDRLALQVYPRLLPFNLPLEEARTYLGHLGVSLAELMRVIHRPGLAGPALNQLDQQIAIESLGLSPTAAHIVMGSLPPRRAPEQFWGIDAAGWPDALADLPTFLKQAELTYDAFEELIATQFINGDGAIKVQFQTQCNIEGAVIQNITKEPLEALDRIHRFLRLQQALGWEIRELDETMTAMQTADLTMEFLAQASQIQSLKSELDVPYLEMLSWWSNISTTVNKQDDEDRSLYEQLFLNNAVLNPIDEAFALDAIATGTELIGEHTAAILAALEITEDDLALILADEGIDESDGLTLELLSRLYRNASLAKALDLSAEEFSSLRALTGIDPFADPQATLDFAADAQTVDATAFTIASLDYLLRHVYEESSGVSPADTSITLVLDGVKSGLGTIAAENTFAPDPTGGLTQGRLALILTGDDLAEAIAIIESTSTGSGADQAAFIDEHFASFINPADAKVQLLGPNAIENRQARYEYVLEPLATYLKTTLSTQFVVQSLATALSLEVAVSEDLLTVYLTTPAAPSINAIDAFLGITPETEVYSEGVLDTYRLLDKTATVINALKVTAEELSWVFKTGPSNGWLDLAHLPLSADSDATAIARRYAGWRRLAALYEFRDEHPAAGDVTVFSVLDLARLESDRGTILQALSTLTGWTFDDLDHLTGPAGFNFTGPEDYRDERFLLHLQAAMAVLQRLGISAEAAAAWRVDENLVKMKATARDIKSTVKAKYDNPTWLTVTEPLKNTLREKQRDALAAYLIARDATLDDASDLFERYLIDTEMRSCMETSRIKQAISSVQLFVQRGLMNLESTVEITQTAAEQWPWMKNYRVWEANRKIFLYPENWIVPELRDDKSPFFKDLENELLQNELNEETAETALLAYLGKLNEVANLDVCALYHQKEEVDSGIPVDILHVIARTYSSPHVYYYRQYVDAAYWTPWKQIEIDIEGDHILAAVWNRRLYLFWAIFEEGTEEADTQWEIHPAWSEYKNGAWSAKKTGGDLLKIPRSDAYSAKSHYLFRPEINAQNELIISCIYQYDVWGLFGQFRFTGCNDRMFIDTGVGSEVEAILMPWPTLLENMRFHESEEFVEGTKLPAEGAPFEIWKGDFDLAGDLLDDTRERIPVLNKTPGLFTAVLPLQYDQFASQDAFFFQDETRSFHVTPLDGPLWNKTVTGLQNENEVSLDNYAGFSWQLFNADITARQHKNGQLETSLQNGGRPFGPTGSASRAVEFSKVDQTVTIDDLLDQAAQTSSSSPFQVNGTIQTTTQKTYKFHNAYHPHTCLLNKELNRGGIDALMQRSLQATSDEDEAKSFAATYLPVAGTVNVDHPEEIIDFSEDGAYGKYGWELFFHAPLLIATRLSQNQRFEDAQRWFHYIFNPMARSDSPAVTGPERYWNFYPFYEENTEQTIEQLMLELNEGDAELAKQVELWRQNPFNPHLIARLRPVAYQKTVVMKYLDNLIAWGDTLFRQDTIESINEATQLYVLAANVLGPRPQSLAASDVADSETYNSLADRLDEFSNALVQIENQVPDVFSPDSRTSSPLSGYGPEPFSVDDLFPWLDAGTIQLPALHTLYFCIPNNEMLTGYWDTVEDRLFKIRNCMNIEGVVRELALFEPPIDPALLVQAAAAGVDFSSALSDLYAPMPHYRFDFLLRKAAELCGDVRSLGAALLSALATQDAEELALLKAGQEKELLESIRLSREQQVEEAKQTLESLEKARGLSEARQTYYQQLLDSGLSPQEALNLIHLSVAHGFQSMAQQYEVEASQAFGSGDITVSMSIPPSGGASTTFGGSHRGNKIRAQAASFQFYASQATFQANMASTLGGYERRRQEWQHQADLAAIELEQVDKQIAAAAIRVAISELERDQTNKQIEQAQEVYDFLKTKYTDQELYGWMVSQISSIYFMSYGMAYDLAKRAEKAYQHELGASESSFILFGYWDSLKKGLLSGEKLNYDLRRMEMSYLDLNKREYELTKHVSLRQLDPLALLTLKATGACEVSLPEWMFDMENPGHYMRRIKNVSLSMPSITGPYTSVNCTLSLLKSSLRKSSLLKDGEYARQGSEDDRFVDSFGAIQSIVTSSGNNDSGLFETNLRDERFLPFEGAGAESTWTLELPAIFRPFDYNTISDVILHVRYTSRPGGAELRGEAVKYTEELLGQESESGLAMLFSLKHDFPNEWHQFLTGSGDFTAAVKRDYFPYFTQGRAITIDAVQLHAIQGGQLASVTPEGVDPADLTDALEDEGAFVLSLAPDDSVLVREPGAYVFALIEYSVAAV